jgi:hypothetical protein
MLKGANGPRGDASATPQSHRLRPDDHPPCQPNHKDARRTHAQRLIRVCVLLLVLLLLLLLYPLQSPQHVDTCHPVPHPGGAVPAASQAEDTIRGA